MEDVLGKKLPFRKEFPTAEGDDFAGISAAKEFLTSKGYSFGSMQREAPIGIYKGLPGQPVLISKWRNLSDDDKKALNGVIVFEGGSPRDGTAVVLLDTEVE